ncbi:MAG: hypothetical protein QW453_05650 [Thermoprotei archaeon]
MAKHTKSGQFIILTAALVLIIMISVVAFLYTNIPTNQITAQNVLGAVNSVEQAAAKVLAAGASYYSTILNVTGNYTYARQRATTLVYSGFNTLYNLYSYYGFTYLVSRPIFSAYWYSPYSYTYAKSTYTFNLTSLGLANMNTNATQELTVHIVCPPNCAGKNQAVVQVGEQGGAPITNLQQTNFYFEVYNKNLNAWVKQNPTQFTNYGNGTYSLSYTGFQPTYILGVVDQRGILVIAQSYSSIIYTFTWPRYQQTIKQPFVVQIYNNGTLSMLGQSLTSNSYPIPPVPVKDILVNETNSSSSTPYQVPFQVEDWASNYTVPLGLAGNQTLFSGFQMIAVLVTPSVTESLTVYWKGLDSWNQTPYAIPCTTQSKKYFSNQCSNTPNQGPSTISNGILNIQVNIGGAGVQLSIGGATVTFVRADQTYSFNAGGVSYTILPGVVRDILQVEPENSGGFGEAYSVYFQLVLLIPAYTDYIEAFQRVFFVNVSNSVNRNVNDLMLNQIAVNGNYQVFIQTSQNGWTQVFSGTDVFDQYNATALWGMICSSQSDGSGGNSYQGNRGDPCSSSQWVAGFIMGSPQWSQLTSLTSGTKCGGGVLASANSQTYLEIDPVLYPTCASGITFDNAFTISWWGALVFKPSSSMADPYYLSQIVVNPPKVIVSA